MHIFMHKNMRNFFGHKNMHIFSEQEALMSTKNEREQEKKISALQVCKWLVISETSSKATRPSWRGSTMGREFTPTLCISSTLVSWFFGMSVENYKVSKITLHNDDVSCCYVALLELLNSIVSSCFLKELLKSLRYLPQLSLTFFNQAAWIKTALPWGSSLSISRRSSTHNCKMHKTTSPWVSCFLLFSRQAACPHERHLLGNTDNICEASRAVSFLQIDG